MKPENKLIKPIETYYGGHRFRSRLEARWAVFYDALGIEFQYEAEGFALPSGCYLPDFYLPHIESWIEIKREEPDDIDHLRDQLADLVEATGQRVFLFAGDIANHYRAALGEGYDGADAFEPSGYEGGELIVTWDTRYTWCECPACQALVIWPYSSAGKDGCGHCGDCPDSYSPRLSAAYKSAMQERFESTSRRSEVEARSESAPEEESPPHAIAMLCVLALRDGKALKFLREQDWREILGQIPNGEILARVLEGDLRPDDSAWLDAIDKRFLPQDCRVMAERWWLGIRQSVLRRQLDNAHNRIKLPNLSTSEMLKLQKQILDLQERLCELSACPEQDRE
jgi:hypothetical protein